MQCNVLLLRLRVLQIEAKGQRSCELADLLAAVCLAEIMFSGRAVAGESKVGQGMSVCIYTCAFGKQKGQKTKHAQMTCILGLWMCCFYTRQVQRIKRL